MSDLSDVKSVFLKCPDAPDDALLGANTRYQLGAATGDDDFELPEVYWLRALYVSYTTGGVLINGRMDFVTDSSGGSPSDSDSDWIMSAGWGNITGGQSIIIPDDSYIRVVRGDTPLSASGYSPTGIWAVSNRAAAAYYLRVTMVYT